MCHTFLNIPELPPNSIYFDFSQHKKSHYFCPTNHQSTNPPVTNPPITNHQQTNHYPAMIQNWFKDMIERHAFGVCQYLGERMRVAPGEVRKYFIYTSFIGMGSPLIVYLFVAFWMNVRRYIRRGQNEIYN